MAHSAGFLGLGHCAGTWRNVGRATFGTQHQRCSKCGRVRNKRIRRCFPFCTRWSRTRKDPALRCRRCGRLKP